MVGVIEIDEVLHDTPQPTIHKVSERARRMVVSLFFFGLIFPKITINQGLMQADVGLSGFPVNSPQVPSKEG